MEEKIQVAILDDHQPIIDGYSARIHQTEDIEVVAVAYYGEQLEPLLVDQRIDVLLLDVQLPTSPENDSPYPILFLIPRLLQAYPDIAILVISMHNNRTLIQAVMEAGASGYILKDDQDTIQNLPEVIRTAANGGIHISQKAFEQLDKHPNAEHNLPLTSRQLEALSLSAAYPHESSFDLAQRMNIAHSTFRNLLSQAYLKLEVRNRTAAIARARQLGLLPGSPEGPDLTALGG